MSDTTYRQRNFIYYALIVLISLLGFLNSLHNPFIFDDEQFIVRNPYIHSLWNLHFYPARVIGHWSFALNYALGGLDVEGYHLLNIFLHAACGCFVFWLCSLLLDTPRLRRESLNLKKPQFAFWAAVIFVIHPIQTMAVNHITQRYVLLAALFYLAGLSFYIKGRLSGRGVWFLALITSVLLGVFSRQSFMTFPLMLLFFEIFLFKRDKPSDQSFYKKLFAVMAAILLAGLWLHRSYVLQIFSKTYLSQSHLGETIAWANYFLTQFKVILIYLKLLVVPIGLNFDYDIPLAQSILQLPVILGFLSVGALLALAYRFKNQWPLVSLGICWFFLTLLPESSIIPIPYVIAEYRLYLPLFGFSLVLIALLQKLIKNPKMFFWLMFGLTVMGLFLTVQRNRVYRSEISLWSDVIEKSPQRVGAYTNLGAAYIKSGQCSKALDVLKRGVELGGGKDYKTLYNLAQSYVLLGRQQEGIDLYEKLLKIEPTPWVYNNLALIYEAQGDLDKAKSYLWKAHPQSAFYPEIRLNLARVLWRKGHVDKAIALYLKVLSKYPLENRARYALVQLYLQTKESDKAQIMASQILSLKDPDINQLTLIGTAFAQNGEFLTALDFFDKVLSIDQSNADAYLQAGKIMGNLNKLDEAIHIWQMGQEHCPTDPRFKDLIQQALDLRAKQPAARI